jgi:hypothetical protein
MGRIRPPGPFSFISGAITYAALALASLLALHFTRLRVPLVVAAAAWAALVLAGSVSGSRAFVISVAPVFGAAFLAFVLRPQLFGTAVRMAAVAVFVVALVSASTVAQEGVEVFSARLDSTGGLPGVIARIRGSYFTTVSAWNTAPLFGVGLGAGTNAGTALSGGAFFRYGEDEWTRVIFEAGPVLGLAYLVWRVWLAWRLIGGAWHAATLGFVAPMLLVSACAVNIVLGQWGQPNMQGMTVFAAGLCAAACRQASEAVARAVTPGRAPAPAAVHLAHPVRAWVR